jgi:hypothetical protein
MRSTLAPPRSGSRLDSTFLPILIAACSTGVWLVEPGEGRSRSWIRVRHGRAATPAQGWKLHVSATVASAAEVLQAALPVLLDDDATFKVAASMEMLAALNEGNGGWSQIGKFITIYPRDDAQAVRLAARLDEATRGLRGPAVPSDRPLRHGRGIVSYRYGGFSTPLMQTPLGEVLPSLIIADGQLVPDRRRPWYSVPEGIDDPFVAAGVAGPQQPPNLLVADRYALITLVQSSPRGAVCLAVDTQTARRVIVKRARADALGSEQGHDARDRLRAEADVLTALAPHPGIPVVHDLVEDQDDVYLVMEDIEGETLEEYTGRLMRYGRCLPPEQVVSWGCALAQILGHVHARGFVYRDLKSPNVIVARDGSLRLIDFDMAQRAGDTSAPFGKGTRGYTSPQQHAGRPPAITDDVYGLGALLYYLATGAEPSRAPDEFSLGNRAIETLNPAIPPALARVIARCLAPEPHDRYPSMEAVEQALKTSQQVEPVAIQRSAATKDDARHHARDLARRLADTLCAVALPAPNGDGLAWATSHPLGTGGIRMRDINIGSAGTLLALAELAGAFGTPRYRETLAQGARWLTTAPPFAGDPLAGLYVGEAGIGAALLRAGQVLDDTALIDAAIDKGRYVASLPHTSPDLFNGAAGRLRFHLCLWDQTGADEHLAAARAAVTMLLEAADRTADGAVRWVMTAGYGSMSGTASLGYAHGAAGIADALLDLFEATGDTAARDAAAGTARWLANLAVPVLDDGRGIGWPATEGEEPFLPWWCHGASGIGRLFLHATTLDLIPEAAGLVTGAARAVARGSRTQAASQCHGLAGSIEFLLDVYQATGDDTWLHEARNLATLLEAHATEQDGNLVYSAETPGVFTPDYMTGYGGVAVCLLRLADPERRPHQLSRAGFRHREG